MLLCTRKKHHLAYELEPSRFLYLLHRQRGISPEYESGRGVPPPEIVGHTDGLHCRMLRRVAHLWPSLPRRRHHHTHEKERSAMIFFHTSNIAVPQPDVLHSRKYLDFGQGFYVTPTKVQAVNYAQRFTMWGEDAYLNSYEMATPDTSVFRCKRFDSYDEGNPSPDEIRPHHRADSRRPRHLQR